MNFGVGDYNVRQEVAMYRFKARAWRPDVILSTYVLNDPLTRASTMRVVGAILKQRKAELAAAPGSEKGSEAKPVKAESHREMSRWPESRLVRLIADRARAIRDPDTKKISAAYFRIHRPQTRGWIDAQKALADLAVMAREDRVPVVLAILPLRLELWDRP